MAAENFQACLREILKHEGGYVDHPKDPGGATNLGITIGTLRAWRGGHVTKMDVRALTVNEAGQIYRKKYWDAVGGDAIAAGADLATCDYAVNSGPGRGRPAYAAAVKAVGRDPVAQVKHICAGRRAFLMRLKTWSTFGKGWSRRVASVEAVGIRMALALGGASKSVQSGTLSKEGLEADSKAAKKTKQAKATTVSTAAPTPVVASDDWSLWIFGGICIVALAVIAVAFWTQAQDENARADAFLEEAEGVVA
jgi:lysozyme family protein